MLTKVAVSVHHQEEGLGRRWCLFVGTIIVPLYLRHKLVDHPIHTTNNLADPPRLRFPHSTFHRNQQQTIMAAKTTISVPHLGGISAGYRSTGIDAAKPTIVLINSMCTTSSLYNEQFDSKTLTDAVNLLAIEPLGHGATSSATEHFTYWDSATMALQVMEALGVKKAFVLGTSQGGWMVVRMALLAPEQVCFSSDPSLL